MRISEFQRPGFFGATEFTKAIQRASGVAQVKQKYDWTANPRSYGNFGKKEPRLATNSRDPPWRAWARGFCAKPTWLVPVSEM